MKASRLHIHRHTHVYVHQNGCICISRVSYIFTYLPNGLHGDRSAAYYAKAHMHTVNQHIRYAYDCMLRYVGLIWIGTQLQNNNNNNNNS